MYLKLFTYTEGIWKTQHMAKLTGEEQQMSLRIQGAGEIPQARADVRIVTNCVQIVD